MSALLALLCFALLSGPATESIQDEVNFEEALRGVLEKSFPGEFGDAMGPPLGDRWLFMDVLSTPVFQRKEVGPFDLAVFSADGLKDPAKAEKVLNLAATSLAKVAKVVESSFTDRESDLGKQRFPIVLLSSDRAAGDGAFDEMVALLEWCDGSWTSWGEANGSLWTDEKRNAQVVRTWEVLLINLGEPAATGLGGDFLDHGVGYQAIVHLVNRVIRKGSWGNVPPWLAHGLIDEMDIQAFGEAWVGGDAYEKITAGWSRPGWSGFVPEGQLPPPPVRGPPKDLAVTVRETGESWGRRSASGERHWADLATDRESAAPASFAFMAQNESFLPRDRAFARCAIHLLLRTSMSGRGRDLIAALDRAFEVRADGMPGAPPLPSVVAWSLGGIAGIDALEEMSLGDFLQGLGRDDLLKKVRDMGGEGVLPLADHRDQSRWLYEQVDLGQEERAALFDVFLEVEYHQQMVAWELVGESFDRAVEASLNVTSEFPSDPDIWRKVSMAFDQALGEH
ncbi:MAG: hypothetical protein VX916_01040 [Planctomycetota bacterium]|nr:hypothetical protein [Planctomycetota bacterium]